MQALLTCGGGCASRCLACHNRASGLASPARSSPSLMGQVWDHAVAATQQIRFLLLHTQLALAQAVSWCCAGLHFQQHSSVR
jgi:hypothetical protein